MKQCPKHGIELDKTLSCRICQEINADNKKTANNFYAFIRKMKLKLPPEYEDKLIKTFEQARNAKISENFKELDTLMGNFKQILSDLLKERHMNTEVIKELNEEFEKAINKFKPNGA